MSRLSKYKLYFEYNRTLKEEKRKLKARTIKQPAIIKV